jgi:DnaJ-class molecular chaperone
MAPSSACAERVPPKLGKGAGAQEKGDIHYRFVIDVPKDLSAEQQQALDVLSKTMDSDPRKGLFENGAKAAGAAGEPAGSERSAPKAGEAQ